MSTPTHAQSERAPSGGKPAEGKKTLPVIADAMPILYEDEGQDEMGESIPHTDADHDLSMGLKEHLRELPNHRVASNLNVYYHPTDRRAYVSPDVMVVVTDQPLPSNLSSYRIGPGRPAPIFALEILSRRSFQQQDLTNKPTIYGALGIAEYVLVDGTGELLPEKVLLKRWVDSETWDDEQDPDGGVTSRLGFRIAIEEDGRPRVIDLRTGRRYLRPDEAHAAIAAAVEAQRRAEERIQALEAELARLRGGQT